MLRLLFRLLLIAYALLPVIAIVLFIATVRNVQSELVPVYETASQTIGSATDALRDDLRTLRSNFQPLVNAVNNLRSALSTINTFIRNSVNAVIDWVADTTFGVIQIPRFGGITLPAIVNLSFIDNISSRVDIIGTQVETVVESTGSIIMSQLDTLTAALIMLAVWVALGPVLMLILVLSGALRV